MNETDWIWLNGEFVAWRDAKIHVLSHSMHYGSAVFEGIRFYSTSRGAAIFRLREHVDRLFKSASAFGMEVKYKKDEFVTAIVDCVRKNGLKNGYIRPIIFFGYGSIGLNPSGADLGVAIAVWPWGSYLGEKPVSVKTSSFMRIHPKSSKIELKISGHYVNSILSSLEAKRDGYDEALLLDFEGNIAEGPGENLFVVRNGKIFTPSLGNILNGITRDSVMQIARDKGMEVIEKSLSLEEVYSADEVFFTGTAAEVTPISSVDDNLIKNEFGPITHELRESYMEIVKGKNSRYENWLKFVN